MRSPRELLVAAERWSAPWRRPQLARVLVPLFPLLCLAPWLVRQIKVEQDAPLFRDAAMIQYTGWCIRHGLRLYKDVATPDGPFIHFFHALLQVFWGIRDAGARKGDLLVQVVGAGVLGLALSPRLPRGDSARIPARLVWTALGLCAWLPWYLDGGWEHTVQRDPYYALVGYLGMVLLYASARFERRAALAAAFVGGVLTTLQLFTRQSGVVYPALALLGIFLEKRADLLWWPRLRAGLFGALAALLGMLLALLLFGSVSGFFFWYFRVPVEIYRFIGTKPFADLYTKVYATQLELSLEIAVAVLVAVVGGLLPASALGFGLAPFLFVVAACAAGKGWINHVQQATAAANLVLLVGLSAAWERGLTRRVWGRGNAALAALLLTAFVSRVVGNLASSPFNDVRGYDSAHVSAEEVATDLAATTRSDDRVFYYAHEMHGLLYAERKTALPTFSDMILDFDAWLRHEPPSTPLTPQETEVFTKLQTKIAGDACQRLLRDLPAAIVAKPNDLGTWSNPSFEDDLRVVCPALRPLLTTRYRMHTTGGYQVYLRDDRAPGGAPAGTP